MADLLKSNEIDAGGGYIADRGNWVSGFSETVDGITFTGYALNDIVHTDKAVYLSLVDNNTTNPDTDTTGSWRKCIDKTDINDAVTTVNALVDAWVQTNPVAGMSRIDGDSDPAAETLYGSAQVREIGKHLRLKVVKDGKVVKTAAAGRLTTATNGDDIAIDGTEGDIMLGFDRDTGEDDL